MADGNATETAVAMVDGNCYGKWPTAKAMGGSNSNGDGVSDGDRDGSGNCNGNGHGNGNSDKEKVASSCAGDMQRCGRGNTLPPPP